MEEIEIRFEIIRLALKVRDIETVDIQAESLREISIDDDLHTIISMLEARNFRQALHSMQAYLDKIYSKDDFFDEEPPKRVDIKSEVKTDEQRVIEKEEPSTVVSEFENSKDDITLQKKADESKTVTEQTKSQSQQTSVTKDLKPQTKEQKANPSQQKSIDDIDELEDLYFEDYEDVLDEYEDDMMDIYGMQTDTKVVTEPKIEKNEALNTKHYQKESEKKSEVKVEYELPPKEVLNKPKEQYNDIEIEEENFADTKSYNQNTQNSRYEEPIEEFNISSSSSSISEDNEERVLSLEDIIKLSDHSEDSIERYQGEKSANRVIKETSSIMQQVPYKEQPHIRASRQKSEPTLPSYVSGNKHVERSEYIEQESDSDKPNTPAYKKEDSSGGLLSGIDEVLNPTKLFSFVKRKKSKENKESLADPLSTPIKRQNKIVTDTDDTFDSKEIEVPNSKNSSSEIDFGVKKPLKKRKRRENKPVKYTPISYIGQKFKNMLNQYPPIQRDDTQSCPVVEDMKRKIAQEGYTEEEIEEFLKFYVQFKNENRLWCSAQVLLLAAATESEFAQFLLARELFHGNVLQENHPEAFTQINALADRDFPEAICDLAQLYEYGVGIGKDKKMALMLYEEAAEMGVERAKKHCERLRKSSGLLGLFKLK